MLIQTLFRRLNQRYFHVKYSQNVSQISRKVTTFLHDKHFSVAACASNYNLQVTKSLTNVNTKTISDDKCIRYDLPKVINETDKDIMDKIATHSYQDFAFYFKRVTIRKDNQNFHIHNCYACKSHSTENVHNSL